MELSPSHTSLDELRAEIEASQWTVVSWAADRHDSIDDALCRISDGRHVVVSLQLTPEEDLLHYFSTVWVQNSEGRFAAVRIASGAEPQPFTIDRLDGLLRHAIENWDNPTHRALINVKLDKAIPRLLSHRLRLPKL